MRAQPANLRATSAALRMLCVRLRPASQEQMQMPWHATKGQNRQTRVSLPSQRSARYLATVLVLLASSPTLHADESTLCPPGTFAAGTSCEPCLVDGQWVREHDGTMRRECAVCPAGSIAPSPAAAQCETCQPGNFAAAAASCIEQVTAVPPSNASLVNLDQLPGVVVIAGPDVLAETQFNLNGVRTIGAFRNFIDMDHDPGAWAISPTAIMQEATTALCEDSAYMTLDLGDYRLVTGVTIWHYYADGRRYCNQAVATSITGAFAGEEFLAWSTGTAFGPPETPDGNAITFPAKVARYIRHWSGRSDAIDNSDAIVNFIELDVYGYPDAGIVNCTDTESAATCQPCATGNYDHDASPTTACVACPTGRYADTTGAAECSRCPVARHSPEASTSSEDCTAFEQPEYLGCYVQGAQNADMPVSTYLSTPSEIATRSVCQELCSDYQYMGLSWASQCKCGNAFGSDGAAAGERIEECGDEGMNCGVGENTCGYLASVYTAGATPTCSTSVDCADSTALRGNAWEIKLGESQADE